jgi:hypothetical protein
VLSSQEVLLDWYAYLFAGSLAYMSIAIKVVWFVLVSFVRFGWSNSGVAAGNAELGITKHYKFKFIYSLECFISFVLNYICMCLKLLWAFTSFIGCLWISILKAVWNISCYPRKTKSLLLITRFLEYRVAPLSL